MKLDGPHKMPWINNIVPYCSRSVLSLVQDFFAYFRSYYCSSFFLAISAKNNFIANSRRVQFISVVHFDMDM